MINIIAKQNNHISAIVMQDEICSKDSVIAGLKECIRDLWTVVKEWEIEIKITWNNKILWKI